MTTILGASVSGMIHNQTAMDTVANNLANVNTFAFKKTRTLSEGVPDNTASADGSRLGVAQTTTDLIFNPAAVQTTDDKLQFSIQDDTFFSVQDTDGSTAYTRLGDLSSDGAGNVTAIGGRLLQPPVQVPSGMTSPAIDANGVITAIDATGAVQPIGQITLTRFTNPQGLQTLGSGLYRTRSTPVRPRPAPRAVPASQPSCPARSKARTSMRPRNSPTCSSRSGRTRPR